MRKVRDEEEKQAQAQGRLNAQNLFWSWYAPRNFGDWVTPYLFEKLTGREAVLCGTRHLKPGATTVMGCGSILRRIRRPGVAVVWGSGIIDKADTFERPLQVLAVRGPHTRTRMQALGYDCPEVFGDPGLMLPLVYRAQGEAVHDLGLIPHFSELDRFRGLELPKGWRLVDVTQGLEQVVDAIASCRRTVSSSLHGLIVSHAYGVPSSWAAAETELHGDGVKFADYFEAVGVMDAAPCDWGTVLGGDLSTARFLRPDVTAAQEALQRSCPFPAMAVAEAAQ
jgi:pyruvyltransferase